jgi:hypothetical protein
MTGICSLRFPPEVYVCFSFYIIVWDVNVEGEERHTFYNCLCYVDREAMIATGNQCCFLVVVTMRVIKHDVAAKFEGKG